MVSLFDDCYRGRRVVVTGHTGFKGTWLCEWLHGLGAEVTGFSLPAASPSLFAQGRWDQRIARHVEGDLRDLPALEKVFAQTRPDFVFHLAAQPLVRLSYAQPLDTFAVNVLGTAHVLECLRRMSNPCAAVLIASDKCYENPDHEIHAFAEDEPLGGSDPYSASKGAMEIVVQSYRRSFFSSPDASVRIASARAGNCIGGGDWATDRIVPDCIRALSAGRPVDIRNPLAVRPWQHVLEPLGGYLTLGAQLSASLDTPGPLAGAFNFGPGASSNRTVGELVTEILRRWPGGQWQNRPEPGASAECRTLALSIEKAAAILDWRPVWNFRETVDETVQWYRHHAEHPHPAACRDQTAAQIVRYADQARALGVPWAGRPEVVAV